MQIVFLLLACALLVQAFAPHARFPSPAELPSSAAFTSRSALAHIDMMGRKRASKKFIPKPPKEDAALPPPAEEEINPGAVDGTDLLVLEYAASRRAARRSAAPLASLASARACETLLPPLLLLSAM